MEEIKVRVVKRLVQGEYRYYVEKYLSEWEDNSWYEIDWFFDENEAVHRATNTKRDYINQVGEVVYEC